MKKLILALFMCFALVSCDTTNTYPEMDYNSFIKDFITTPEEQLTQEESVYYIYFYGVTCGACQNIKNEALYTIEFLEVDKVYFVDAFTVGVNTDIPITGTPSIVKVVNGEVVDYTKEVSDVLKVLHGLS